MLGRLGPSCASWKSASTKRRRIPRWCGRLRPRPSPSCRPSAPGCHHVRERAQGARGWKLRHFAEDEDIRAEASLSKMKPLHERLRDAQARVQPEQDRVQRNQAAIEQAQRSLDQADDKLTFAASLAANQPRSIASQPLPSLPSWTSGITSLVQQATTSGRAVSLTANQISSTTTVPSLSWGRSRAIPGW